ncbi:hypothetical protein HPB47_012483 [Ixodes persulcatus]|uniref:Uncharacterized protein n=1 Tax=Ixodes persulcatus TaxID=34615 RepID=A0AC60NTF6_IXOPE|nr:hypothetical protein HPB47_012483 [Ixodes persulcatus]
MVQDMEVETEEASVNGSCPLQVPHTLSTTMNWTFVLQDDDVTDHKQKKYIVFHNSLMGLLQRCLRCGATNCEVRLSFAGSFMRATITCPKQHKESTEVSSSNRMEKEGLARAFSSFESKNVKVDMLVTDRHREVNAYVRDNHPDVLHRFDAWHFAKACAHGDIKDRNWLQEGTETFRRLESVDEC